MLPRSAAATGGWAPRALRPPPARCLLHCCCDAMGAPCAHPSAGAAPFVSLHPVAALAHTPAPPLQAAAHAVGDDGAVPVDDVGDRLPGADVPAGAPHLARLAGGGKARRDLRRRRRRTAAADRPPLVSLLFGFAHSSLPPALLLRSSVRCFVLLVVQAIATHNNNSMRCTARLGRTKTGRRVVFHHWRAAGGPVLAGVDRPLSGAPRAGVTSPRRRFRPPPTTRAWWRRPRRGSPRGSA